MAARDICNELFPLVPRVQVWTFRILTDFAGNQSFCLHFKILGTIFDGTESGGHSEHEAATL